ncbi:pseudouridine synthase [Serpentinicella alkaliphila]|uniref:Pseudouridine synthase n=1 Tax=Serpentinicella alkaliphila TaxID=1734049 RepID=A0A4R2TAJ8_9FIRM|nr:pseudouridine synthase [Serpentinicella alkaliphila]QUH25789.1 rRNA pseudouridine synthase [Serpentinicella alkaliphila]TCP99790.1 ribosomal small subunit pseudouridine synthase A [Serpentinicella alkaliphila]
MGKTLRLDKILANLGYGSRKDIRKICKQGLVIVDNKVVKDSSKHVDPYESEIKIGDEIIEYKEFVYLMMNKPDGVISATEDSIHQTVIDLLDEEHRIFEPFPVGRLDKDTEGLLLLTNDGKLAHQLLSPKKHVPKTYYAKVIGKVTDEDIKKFEIGVKIEEEYTTLPAELVILKSDEISEIELTIYEGKFHQVKRMFEAVDKKVEYLKRLSMGPLQLDEDLQLGEYRELTDEELEELFQIKI